MTLKVLILLFLVSSHGEAQENSEPNLTLNERFMYLGPNSIHSIKGKFYEERQRKIIAKPDIDKENLDRSQQILPNIPNPELPRPYEKILYRRNKDNEDSNSVYNTKEPKIKAYNSNARNDESKKLQELQANYSNSTFILDKPIQDLSAKELLNSNFHAENLVSNFHKNSSMETLKKEFAFDSLLIKNNVNNMDMIQAPSNIMSSYMSQEINPESAIMDNPVGLQVDDNRRSATNAYLDPNQRLATNFYKPIINDPFQIPVRDENTEPITHNIDDENNLPNHINLATKVPNQRLATNIYKPIIHDPFQIPVRDENTVPITYNIDDETNLPNHLNLATVPLRRPNYNVIDKNSCDDKESDEAMERSGIDVQLKDPTKGIGITNVGKSRVMLMDHPRVCYACSSINDPSCWSPDRSTSVKYCRTDHLSCLTKFYKYKGLSYIIRDCGNTCDQRDSIGGPTKYTSCTICHHDLCNSAYHFKIQNFTISLFLLFHLFLAFIVTVN